MYNIHLEQEKLTKKIIHGLQKMQLHINDPEVVIEDFDEIDVAFNDSLKSHEPLHVFNTDMIVAYNFWDHWLDEARHGYSNIYDIGNAEKWNVLSSEICLCLLEKKTIKNEVLIDKFAAKTK